MSIMDMLSQAAGGQGGPPQGPDPSQGYGDPSQGQDQGGSHGDEIKAILDQVRSAAQNSDDEQEGLTWEKISTMIQQILAQQEKQDQEMLQGKLPPGALTRALGGAGG